MLRELVTQPFKTVVALIELPGTVHRSLRQANDLMEQSQRQLEAIETQTDEALKQAERMNDLLTKVVKLTEPLEYAQRGSEHVAGRLKRALFGEELEQAEQAVVDAGRRPPTPRRPPARPRTRPPSQNRRTRRRRSMSRPGSRPPPRTTPAASR